ncbi:DUF4434 domain-containing protein [Chitinibacter sp. ZOR0017]|uniref:DUF4434 domain-containing protein n=1 Tax=Chitinibacter sp. ZOR0017 TaxID=1339254 RepID=UPI00068EF5AF|nr:DUF4434 domain-containing protein [Chitinibacter sp. ZOR0017]
MDKRIAGYAALLLSLLAHPAQSALECSSQPAPMVFYQPLLRHQGLSEEMLEPIKAKLQARQVKTIILQWSRYGAYSLWDSGGYDWLQRRLCGNRKYQFIFGLYADPQFFERLKLSDAELKDYLHVLAQANLAEAAKIKPHMGEQVKGWYLSEEIDDLNWQSLPRQQMLAEHLREQVVALRKLTPGKPVYVSTFFGGHSPPRVYAEMLQRLQQQSGVIWLVQDGQGVRRDPRPDTAAYLQAVAATLPAERWQGVLEVFTERVQDGQSSFCPVSRPTEARRQQLWCAATGRAAQAVFSLNQLAGEQLLDPGQQCRSQNQRIR